MDEITMQNLLALRNLFFAQHAADLRRAVDALPATTRRNLPPVPDWDEEEYAFNSLFVGPKHVEAPPFASVYLDEPSQVMGEATMDARAVYSALGLENPDRNTFPDDHVSFELEALVHLAHARHQAPGKAQEELYCFFVNDHLGVWIPLFVDRILASEHATALFRFAAVLLKRELAGLCSCTVNLQRRETI